MAVHSRSGPTPETRASSRVVPHVAHVRSEHKLAAEAMVAADDLIDRLEKVGLGPTVSANILRVGIIAIPRSIISRRRA